MSPSYDHPPCSQAAGHDTDNCCDTCHGHWENDGEFMCEGFDNEGYDLHVCCMAANVSRAYLQEHRILSKNRERTP